MNYAWDKRTAEQVSSDFERGKENEKLAMFAITNYCNISNINGNVITDYKGLGNDEKFEADGNLKAYQPDFVVYMYNLEKQTTIKCNAEIKTSKYVLVKDIWVKKSQLDKLIKDWENPLVVICDPTKFAIISASKFIKGSQVINEEVLGGKEVYIYPYSEINWHNFKNKLEFV